MNELKLALRKRIENGEDLENVSVKLINKMMDNFEITGEMAKDILFSVYKSL